MHEIYSIQNTQTEGKVIDLENIHAKFSKNIDGSYDIVLEINSNKFLITIEKIANQIERMEIITSK